MTRDQIKALISEGCKHDSGFQWYHNAADGSQGWVCNIGCGFELPFDPKNFLGEPVKILNEPNPKIQWKDGPKLSEEGKF